MSGPTIGISPTANQTGGTTLTTPTGHTSQATGSSFLVTFRNASQGSPESVTDSYSNTYTKLQSEVSTSEGFYLASYLCPNGVGGANHTFTVTSTATYVQGMEALEIIGAAISSPVEQNAAFYNPIGTPVPFSTPVTTVLANQLVIGVAAQNQGPAANYPLPNGGFTLVNSITTTDSQSSGSIAATSAGTYNPQWTFFIPGDGDTDMVVMMFSFKPFTPTNTVPIAWTT